MASYSCSPSGTSVTITVRGISARQTIRFFIRLESGSTAIIDECYTSSGTSMTKTFNGLQRGADYAANVCLGTQVNWIGIQYFTTSGSGGSPGPSYPSIEKWSWYSSNGGATSWQTSQAYDAVTRNGNLSDFSYLVWNDMVDKAKEILDHIGQSWYNGYATYYGTKMSSYDRVLTADRFNSLRENIGWRVATGIDPVSKGDVVRGRYFTRLADCMNEWIDKVS